MKIVRYYTALAFLEKTVPGFDKWSPCIQYLATIDLLDGVCYHPIDLRVPDIRCFEPGRDRSCDPHPAFCPACHCRVDKDHSPRQTKHGARNRRRAELGRPLRIAPDAGRVPAIPVEMMR